MSSRLAWLAAFLLLAACAATPLRAPSPDVLLLGEQHDAPAHQVQHLRAVQSLIAQGRLAALAVEMADRGTSTAGLPRDADPARVRAALGWSEQAWPWAPYAPAVMAAVHAGVPVLGANLPRASMAAAMKDARWDSRLAPAALERQREAVRTGHCGLLPAQHIAPMTRIQIARDQAMADTLSEAARPGATVVLLAGAGHVDPELGVPQHLPAGLRVQSIAWAPVATGKDYCQALRQSLGVSRGAAAGFPLAHFR